MQNMMSRDETASLLRVSVSTISLFVARGLLPEPIRIGRRYWWSRDVIEHISHVGTGNRNWKKESNNG
jgi:DNA-binding transcriptional MerR regulator